MHLEAADYFTKIKPFFFLYKKSLQQTNERGKLAMDRSPEF